VLCSQCAEILPDDARFCLKCGQPVDHTAASAISTTGPATTRTAKPPRARRKPRSAIWVFLLVVLVAIWWAATSDSTTAQQLRELATGAHTEAITEKPFSVNAHSFSSYKFTVPSGAVNVFVSGQFSATSGPGNEGEVYVLSDYDSGKVSQGAIHAMLPLGAGTYYLVFSNNFSVKTAKAVQADVTLHYNTWWPDWLFHIKDKLWGT
jgi:hypothetical protein